MVLFPLSIAICVVLASIPPALFSTGEGEGGGEGGPEEEKKEGEVEGGERRRRGAQGNRISRESSPSHIDGNDVFYH